MREFVRTVRLSTDGAATVGFCAHNPRSQRTVVSVVMAVQALQFSCVGKHESSLQCRHDTSQLGIVEETAFGCALFFGVSSFVVGCGYKNSRTTVGGTTGSMKTFNGGVRSICKSNTVVIQRFRRWGKVCYTHSDGLL